METDIYGPQTANFTGSDIDILKSYYQFNRRYYKQINEDLTVDLHDHPLWGPLMQLQSKEQRMAQNERSNELQRAAIYEGKWKPYREELIMQGRTYARMNVNYADWYRLVKIYRDYLMPYVKKDFGNSAAEAITCMDGLSKLIDYAMYCIAESYFQEKNIIIRANEERFRAIFENSADNISLIDHNAKIKMVNHVESGWKKEDLIGMSLFDIGRSSDPEDVKQAIKTVFTKKKPATYETSIMRNNETTYYSNSASPVFDNDGTVSAAVIISRNITERKKAEAEVAELNSTLEQKVLERTEELKNINQELESFSYSVSHDLRAPLRGINGFAEILLDEYATTLADDAREWLREIIYNTQRMGTLIDDLLEFSRLGKQELVKVTLDMNVLIRAVMAENKVERHDSSIHFDIKPLQCARGDRSMIKQVLTNLVTNAIKYSAKKDRPVIEVGCYSDGNNVVYYVKDNGAGFDMVYYKKMFGVFQRLHSPKEFEGTGVGLAIVKRIISKHNGNVWAEGKPGEGATFYISLPN